MRSSELFGVALLIMGLWNLYHAAYDFVFFLMKSSGAATNSMTPISEDKILIGFHLFVALILLLATGKIVKLFFAPPA